MYNNYVVLISDDRMLGEFYKEYSKSAKVLAEFDIPMYMVTTLIKNLHKPPLIVEAI